MNKYRAWDFWADKYNNLWVQKYSLMPTRKKIIKNILEINDKKKTIQILDIGCATGQLAFDLYKEDIKFNYLGIDVSKKMITEALKYKKPNIKFEVCNIEALEVEFLKGMTFDVIICSHSFPYFEDKKAVVEKITTILSKGGMFILVNAVENNIYDKIIMNFVKITTSKAKYLSINDLSAMLKESGLIKNNIDIIKEKFYMPNIYYINYLK